jgi:hypothetical protein
MQARTDKILKCLRIELVYPAESTKLAFSPIKVSVMIFVRRNELRFANMVDHFDSVDDLHWEWEFRQPGVPLA